MKTPNRHSDDVSTHKRRTYYTLHIYIYIVGGGVAVILLSVPTRAHTRIYTYRTLPRANRLFLSPPSCTYTQTRADIILTYIACMLDCVSVYIYYSARATCEYIVLYVIQYVITRAAVHGGISA